MLQCWVHTAQLSQRCRLLSGRSPGGVCSGGVSSVPGMRWYKWWARAGLGMGRSVISRWIKRGTSPVAPKFGVADRLPIQVQYWLLMLEVHRCL